MSKEIEDAIQDAIQAGLGLIEKKGYQYEDYLEIFTCFKDIDVMEALKATAEYATRHMEDHMEASYQRGKAKGRTEALEEHAMKHECSRKPIKFKAQELLE